MDLTSEAERKWYQDRNCHHSHCPFSHEHPQPFLLDDGRLVCGYCAILDGVLTEMVPCTPEVC